MAKKVVQTIQPFGDRVLVRPISHEEITQSGIIIPDTASKEKPEKGEVLAVGPGERNEQGTRIALDVQVGQRVMFTKYGPNEIEADGEELLIIKEKDILAIVN